MNIGTSLGNNIQAYLDLTASELKLTASNMANVSTPGYTQEDVIWNTAAPSADGGVSIANGVASVQAQSQRDLVLNKSIDLETQSLSSSTSRLTALQTLQATFAQSISGSSASSSGITESISGLFSSFQELESAPESQASRESVLSAAQNVAGAFQTAAGSIQQQQTSLNGEVGGIVSQINSLTSSIASLNAQIESRSPDVDAGTLEDQRQYALQSLSKLIGVDVITTENDGLTITTAGGSTLVAGNSNVTLSTATNSMGLTQIYSGSDNITSSLETGGGSVGGMLQARDGDLAGAMDQLDTLAYNLGTAINSVSEGGVDANGDPGTAMFDLPSTQTGAADSISVAIDDPDLVAAASTGGGAGDGSNAALLADVANQGVVNGQTPLGYLSSFVSGLGDTITGVTATQEAQQASLTQLQNQQSSISAVSLDNEATSLQNIEQAYQAASKVFTILDQLMASAINLGTETTVS